MNVAKGILQRLLPALVVLVTMLAGMALAEEPRYSVSGTVSYGGAKNGRVYISAVSYGDTAYGVSLGSPGQFTIKGLPPGDYELQAFIDTTGTGQRHAFDPFGKSSVIRVSDYNVNAAFVTVRDTETLPPVAPEFVRVLPVAGGAMVEWEPPRNDFGQTSVAAFNVYWSTEPDPGPGKTAGGGERKGIVAGDNNFIILNGLTNGVSYYFSVSSTLNDVESAPSPHVKTTINAPVGGNGISGTVSFGNLVPQGGLYLAAEKKEGGMFLAAVTTPVSPQTFTIPAVPDGEYKIYGFLDMNGNSVIDAGDLMIGDEAAPVVTVSGAPVSDLVIALTTVPFQSSLRTKHMKWGDGESYEIEFDVEPATKQPVGVRLMTAPTPNAIPAVATPIDIGLNEWGQFRARFQVKLRPGEGQEYGIRVFYADGTFDDKNLVVTGVVDAFATPVSPIGSATYQPVPTFTWEAPQQAPEKFSYTLWMDGQTPGAFFHWGAEDLLPSDQTSVAYNFNGFAQYGELPNNGRYQWTIGVVDRFGNAALNNATFTYGYGSITGKVMNENGEPLAGVQVYAADQNGNQIPDTWPVFTDGNGVYSLSLPAGEYKIHFMGAQGGYISEWYDNAAEASDASLVTVTAEVIFEGVNAVLSRPAFMVSGTVYKGDIALLNDVKVLLYTPDGIDPLYSAFTDQNGYYYISNVPAGQYKVYFDSPVESGCTDSWLLGQSGQPLLITANEFSGAINFHLNCQQPEPTSTTVSGRVFSSVTNAGIANIKAQLTDLNGNPVTMMYSNGEGFYSIPSVKPGTYNVFFDTGNVGACQGEWYKDAAVRANAVQVIVGADPVTLDNATITCQPVQQQLNTFTGAVGNTASGLGQGGVKVSVVDAATGVFTNLFSTTNQDGWYQIPNVPDGSYYLEFSSPGCTTKWFENAATINGAVAVQVSGGATLQNDTFISCGNTNQTTIRFTGKITDGTNPLAGVAVQVVGKPELNATSAQDGSFTIQGIPAFEEYVLKMTAQGFAPSYSINLTSDKDVDTTARPYTMFTDQQIASFGGTPGKGVLRGRVVSETNVTSGYISGAYVTAVKADNESVTYPVFYFDGQKWVSDTTTYGNGMFMVLNIDDNVRVNTWAGKEGWMFYGRSFTGHAGAVSQGRIVGAQETSPYIKAKPPYLSFDSVPVGQDSNPQTITITNLGLQSLTIDAFILTGDEGFAATGGGTNPCNVPVTLQSNATCTLDATFTATSEGPRTATLTAVSNASNGQDFQVSLSGYGSVYQTEPLGVSYTFPADMAEGIAVNGPLFVGFSGNVDSSTVTAQTFTLATSAGTAVAGKVSVDDEGAAFIPAAPLAPLTTYTATLTTGITDTAGTSLAETYTWTFRTGQAVPTTFFSSLKGSGIFSVSDEESSEISVERTREGQNGSLTETKFTFSDTGAWQSSENSEKAWYLTTNGWQLHDDGAAAGTLVTNTDGTGTWTNKYDATTQKIEIAEYDLSGQFFSGYMSPYSWAYDEQKTFPDGARGYSMKMTPLADTYRVYVWDEGSQGDENWVRYWPNGNEVAVTSLEQLLSVFANTQGNVQTLWFGNGLGARFDAGTTAGTLQLFLNNYDTGSQDLTSVQTKGSWQIKDIKGQKLLQLTIPAAQQALLYDGIEPFFAVVDGKVKQGEFEKSGKSRFERRMSFNKIGFEALLGDRPALEASFTLSVSIAEEMRTGGNVNSNPDGISCGTGEACSSSFPAGQNVVLTAKAVAGWTFDGWTDCPSASGSTCTVALNADKTVGAKFRKTDSTPPNTTITKGPDKITGKLEATFTFSATEASIFQCKLDDGEWELCLEGAPAATTGTKTYSDLYDGDHTFAVKATDQAGNEDLTPATFAWTIDTAVPPIDVMDGNGEVPVALSNLKTPSFTVLGEGLVKYKYKLDGGQYSALRDISAKITLATLADGDHILYVIGVNAAGTESDELSIEWTIDTVAPVTQLTEKPAALSNLRSPSFIFTSADAITYECKIDKGIWEECYEEYSPADELLDGRHTFVVRAIDEAGNVEKPGAGQSFTWTVDATPPVAVIKSKPTKPVSGTSATIVVTGKDVVAYKYFVDGVESELETPVKTPLALTGLSDGTHTIEISGRDAAGNWQEENLPVAEVTVDNEAPVAEALSGVPVELTNAKKATIYVGGDGVVAYQYSIDGGAWIGGTKGIAKSKPISLTLKTKAYTLKVIGVDAAGNWQKEQVATYTWTSDVTVPKVVFQKPVSSTVLQGAETILGFTPQLPEPNGVAFTCKVDTELTYSACESAFALGELTPGPHTVSVIATDGAGNVSKPLAYKWTVKAAPVQ